MVGLTDMEELIATVSDKDVANYLSEALACYGTGAYRACVVLAHIALFDGLRRKLKALAPTNGVAKAVSDEIEPLAASQKVFETPMIHKLKTSGIINQLEAQILEQINSHRNKAAHPSGHTVSAEEARYVFSEVTKKFLSQPIRETSYIINVIVSKLPDKNFFPSRKIEDLIAVVDQEISNLDTSARPFLIAKLVSSMLDPDENISGNARNFILVVTRRREEDIRMLLIKHLIDPKCSVVSNATFFSQIVACDPNILKAVERGTRLRVQALLIKNVEIIPVNGPYLELRNPVQVLAACLQHLGEDFMCNEMKDFTNCVLDTTPYSPQFVSAISKKSKIFAILLQNYLEQAASSQWITSNNFAEALPALDKPLAIALTQEQAYRMLVAVLRGAEWKGYGPAALARDRFSSLPALKAKAKKYAISKPMQAEKLLESQGTTMSYKDFNENYLQ